MTTPGTLGGAIEEDIVALFALPPHACAWLSPGPAGLVELLVRLRVTRRLDIARIALGPFGEFCGVAGALCAADVLAVLTDGGGMRDEERVAFVADAPNALLGGLEGELVALLCGDGEDLVAFGLGLVD